MITKLTKPTLMGALRMGGYIGWTLAIMFICQQNLRYYRDDSLLRTVNTTFLAAGAIAGALIVVVLLLLDFDGLLNDRLLKWLPGVIMAEAGVALALANAETMIAFAAIAGVAGALGALAAFSHLLQIKVGQRMMAIGLALAIGGGIRLITAAVTGHASRTGLVIVAAVVGVFAILTVHSRGSSDDNGGLLIGLAEASPRTIISKVPYVYIILPILAGLFWLAHNRINDFAQLKLPAGYDSYETVSYIGFVLAALTAAAFVRLPHLALLFAAGTGIAAAAGMMASLPYMTNGETAMFALMSFGALACTRACIYLFIIVFSMDRPHPLFYAMFGYTVATVAELLGVYLNGRIEEFSLQTCIIILIALMPIGGGLLFWGMRRYGFTQDKLDHRKVVRNLIRRRCAELELSDRDEYMIESIVLDGNGVEELAGHMLFSHNSVKVLLRPIFGKLGVSGIDELRDLFGKAAESEEKFRAKVHEAEEEKRASDKIKARMERREQRDAERRERELAAQEELERKLLEMQTMEQIMGADITIGDSDDSAEEPSDDDDTAAVSDVRSDDDDAEDDDSEDNESEDDESEDDDSEDDESEDDDDSDDDDSEDDESEDDESEDDESEDDESEDDD